MNPVDYKKRRKSPRKKKSLHTETKNTARSLIITLGLMIAALSIVFFMTASAGAQKGYTLEQEKLRNEDLKNQNENVNAKITGESSVSQYIESSLIGEMENIDDLEEKTYITPEDNKVQ